jgi:hypothetical protein
MKYRLLSDTAVFVSDKEQTRERCAGRSRVAGGAECGHEWRVAPLQDNLEASSQEKFGAMNEHSDGR